MSNGEKLGIENIKIMAGFMFLAIDKILSIDSNNNGKVSLTEMLSTLTSLGFQAPKVLKAVPELKGEFNDLDEQEMNELIDYFVENFDLPDDKDKAEKIVEEIVIALKQNYQSYRNIRAITQGTE